MINVMKFMHKNIIIINHSYPLGLASRDILNHMISFGVGDHLQPQFP